MFWKYLLRSLRLCERLFRADSRDSWSRVQTADVRLIRRKAKVLLGIRLRGEIYFEDGLLLLRVVL